ncbi:MAG: MFS transporter [Gammaproteobacteria bacterium]|nr:MFS transporter [Gammaproteobacteria bacterium]
MKRYLQLATLVVAGGAIYPLVYLRQNFEVSLLESFGISISQLSQCYAMLGVIFVVTYLPSGWLTDRVSPRWLIAVSLAMAGLLGLWFATMPDFATLQIIFVGWGIATGLTFWSALIKAVAVLGRADEQGRFFGLLDGGRGLVEAVLATIAVAWFAYLLDSAGRSTSASLRHVIYFYAVFMLVVAPVVLLLLDDGPSATAPENTDDNVMADMKLVLGKREVWLAAFCILCGYQLFWATYSFSAYLQQTYGMTAVAVGFITVAKLWMRPIGAISAGVAGDFFNRETVLAWLLVTASLSLGAMVLVPASTGAGLLLAVVMLVGLLTYAVRGIYWATLESCSVSTRIKGLAIGVISLIGYSPDIYLPLINAALLERYPGKTGYVVYFAGLSAMGLFGALAANRLGKIAAARTP